MNLSAPDKPPLQIILVEDDFDLRQSLADYLRLREMIVTEAASGLEFYKELNKGTLMVSPCQNSFALDLNTDSSAKTACRPIPGGNFH
ncbi:hypothetical protein A8A54_21780 [Brucella pseudogrignonensis]|nr:hypothetical protein A8A54_21780 [Brucella pseudogrignonensis]